MCSILSSCCFVYIVLIKCLGNVYGEMIGVLHLRKLRMAALLRRSALIRRYFECIFSIFLSHFEEIGVTVEL